MNIVYAIEIVSGDTFTATYKVNGIQPTATLTLGFNVKLKTGYSYNASTGKIMHGSDVAFDPTDTNILLQSIGNGICVNITSDNTSPNILQNESLYTVVIPKELSECFAEQHTFFDISVTTIGISDSERYTVVYNKPMMIKKRYTSIIQ